MEGNNEFNQEFVSQPYVDRERVREATRELCEQAAADLIAELKENPNALNEFLERMNAQYQRQRVQNFEALCMMKDVELREMGLTIDQPRETECPYRKTANEEELKRKEEVIRLEAKVKLELLRREHDD